MPSGLYVSGPMEIDGNEIRLTRGYPKDLDAFNAAAEPYGIRIDSDNAPIDRVARMATYLSKRDGDGSRLPTFPEDIAFTLDSAQAMAGELAEFYRDAASKIWRTTADIIQFHERLPNNRYRATIHRFNADAILEPVAEITVAGEGFMEVLGIHGYPVKTCSKRCSIQSTLDIEGLDDYQRTGFWYVGDDPVGQERIVLRAPYWGDGGLLDADVIEARSCSAGGVAALRVRSQTLGDISKKAK